jgi:leucine dehydrogenase
VLVADAYQPTLDAAIEKFGVETVDFESVHTVETDFFSPCALGAGLNQQTIPQLKCKAIVGSANNQLATEKDAERIADEGILYGPDFVVNAGGLINVYDELHGYSKLRAMHRVDAIFEATLKILETAKEQDTNPNAAAIHLARERMRDIGDLRRFRRSGDDRN